MRDEKLKREGTAHKVQRPSKARMARHIKGSLLSLPHKGSGKDRGSKPQGTSCGELSKTHRPSREAHTGGLAKAGWTCDSAGTLGTNLQLEGQAPPMLYTGLYR